MEEIEVPTEHLTEEINEKAKELFRAEENKWTLFVAISTALMAVFAALGSLFAGHHSDEALIFQIKASDQWAFYQAKSIKAEIRKLSLQTSGATTSQEVLAQQEDAIKKIAEGDEQESEAHLQKHLILSRCVTLLQVAIAVSAVSIITRRRFLWYAGIILAIGGISFFVIGVI